MEELHKCEQAELVKKKQIEEEKINQENKLVEIRKEVIESGENLEDFMSKLSSAKSRILEDSELSNIQKLLGNEFSKENIEEIKKILGNDQDIYLKKPILLIESEEWINFKELLKEKNNIKAIKLQTTPVGIRKIGNMNEFLKLLISTGLISIDFDGFFENYPSAVVGLIKNSKLIHLGLANNALGNYNSFTTICNALRDNSFLLSLDFSKNRLEGGNLYKFMSTVISNSKSIAKINLRKNRLEKISYPLQRLWEAMCEKKSIVEEIVLDHRVITKEQTKKYKNFDDYYQEFPLYQAPDEKRFSPEEINQILENNCNKEISEVKPKEIHENITQSKKPFYFSMNLHNLANQEKSASDFLGLDRKIRETVFKKVCDALINDEDTDTIDLSGSLLILTENELDLLCSIIKKKENLRILNLGNNSLYNEKKFRILCDAIQNCKGWVELDLSDNDFGRKKAKENFNLLCKALSGNQTIKFVRLNGRNWNLHIVESRTELIWNLLIKSTCLDEIHTPHRVFMKKDILENPDYDEFLKTHNMK